MAQAAAADGRLHGLPGRGRGRARRRPAGQDPLGPGARGQAASRQAPSEADRTARSRDQSSSGREPGEPAAEPVDQQAVAQAAVADRQRRLPQLVHDRADDAGPGEDHLGPLGLQARRSAVAPRRERLDTARSAGPPRPGRVTDPWTRSGSYFASPCITAVRFVTAPPMPTRASGGATPSIADRSAAMASIARSSTSAARRPGRGGIARCTARRRR